MHEHVDAVRSHDISRNSEFLYHKYSYINYKRCCTKEFQIRFRTAKILGGDNLFSKFRSETVTQVLFAKNSSCMGGQLILDFRVSMRLNVCVLNFR
jgi:hypothetical protein